TDLVGCLKARGEAGVIVTPPTGSGSCGGKPTEAGNGDGEGFVTVTRRKDRKKGKEEKLPEEEARRKQRAWEKKKRKRKRRQKKRLAEKQAALGKSGGPPPALPSVVGRRVEQEGVKGVGLVKTGTRVVMGRIRKEAAVTITCQGDMTYRDALVKLREKVDVSSLGLDGMKCRRGATGSDIYRIRGSQADEKAARLVAAISTAVPGVRASCPRRFGEMRIFGLDASASGTEIRDSLARLCEGTDPKLVVVGEVVAGRGNLGQVYVRAPETVVREAVKRGCLTLGWTRVRVVGLPRRPIRCFRCRARGHVAVRCPCPDEVGGSCFRCGIVGHMAKECTNKPCCLPCKKAGRGRTDHRTGSAVCPIVPPKKLGTDPKLVEVGEVVAGRGNLGQVYVRAPETVVRKAVKRGCLTLGWTRVRVVGLPRRPIRCFRCRARGHVAVRCPCPDEVGGSCFRCGIVGHMAKECTNKPCCLPCKKAGRGRTDHRTGSAVCPIVPPKKLGGICQRALREVIIITILMDKQTFIVANVNHARRAQDLLVHRMREIGAGVALVAEPWWIPPGSAEWCPALGGTPSAAVLHPWPSRVVVAGDFNARSAAWDPGCRENARGRLLKEWASRSGLFLLNNGGHSTCVRPQGSSVVDLVWVTGVIKDRTTACFVDEEESLPDHKLGAALISADWTRPAGTLGADAWVQWLRSSLKRACDIAMPRVGPRSGGRRMVHWWCEEVAARRRDANAARRRWTRARGKNRGGDVLAELREGCRAANRALKLAIAKAKERSWRELLSSVDSDPWGRPYRLVMGKLRAAAAPLTETLEGSDLNSVLSGLFPTDGAAVDSAGESDLEGISDVSAQEVHCAAMKIPGSRAPGPDGVAGMVVRMAAVEAPGMIAGCFSACLREGVFPSVWRAARLVLIRKKAEVIESLGLRVAMEKTEAMVFPSSALRRKRGGVVAKVRAGNAEVSLKRSIRYLGVVLDSDWNFRPHFESLAPRVNRMTRAIARILPNLHGPGIRIRRLYASVLHSVLMYGLPVWWQVVVRDKRIRRVVNAIQRRIAIRVCCAYRTVSFHSVMIVAGIIPLHHLAPRLAEVYVAVRASGESVPLRARVVACMAAKRRAVADWKEEEIGLIGSGAPGERVRLAVAPDLDRWVGGVASLGVTFHSTQLMTGHGCFSAYLFGIRRLESSRCFHCDEPYGDADHTLMACSCWTEQRGVLQSAIGRDVSLSSIVGWAVRDPEGWRAFAQFAGEVMRAKEDEERRRERQCRVLQPGLRRPPRARFRIS
ncbi:hypothetical protein M0802_017023, partial [Mischocyttarus mexicanus]